MELTHSPFSAMPANAHLQNDAKEPQHSSRHPKHMPERPWQHDAHRLHLDPQGNQCPPPGLSRGASLRNIASQSRLLTPHCPWRMVSPAEQSGQLLHCHLQAVPVPPISSRPSPLPSACLQKDHTGSRSMGLRQVLHAPTLPLCLLSTCRGHSGHISGTFWTHQSCLCNSDTFLTAQLTLCLRDEGTHAIFCCQGDVHHACKGAVCDSLPCINK